jgi:hypothetical protein
VQTAWHLVRAGADATAAAELERLQEEQRRLGAKAASRAKDASSASSPSAAATDQRDDEVRRLQARHAELRAKLRELEAAAAPRSADLKQGTPEWRRAREEEWRKRKEAEKHEAGGASNKRKADEGAEGGPGGAALPNYYNDFHESTPLKERQLLDAAARGQVRELVRALQIGANPNCAGIEQVSAAARRGAPLSLSLSAPAVSLSAAAAPRSAQGRGAPRARRTAPHGRRRRPEPLARGRGAGALGGCGRWRRGGGGGRGSGGRRHCCCFSGRGRRRGRGRGRIGP